MRNKVIFLTYSTWSSAGDSQYSASFLEDLCNRHEVIVIGPSRPNFVRCEFILLRCKTGISFSPLKFGTFSFLKSDEIIDVDMKIQFLVVDHLRSVHLLDSIRLAQQAPIVYLAHNKEYTNLYQNLAINRNFSALLKLLLNFRIRHYEKRLLKNAFTIHADESGGDLRYFPRPSEDSANYDFTSEGPVLFIGNLTWFPNTYAITRYVPSLIENVSNTIVLIGRGGSNLKLIAESPNLKLHDFVDKVDAIYPQVSSLLVISLKGTGIKLKIINSLSSGGDVIYNNEILDSLPSLTRDLVKKTSVKLGELNRFNANRFILKAYINEQKQITNAIFKKIDLFVQ